MSAVSSVIVSITESLQADSTQSNAERISTGGLQLFDDLGVVLSFGLTGVFSRNFDLVRRLVPASVTPDGKTQATRLFGPMFQGHRRVTEAELEELER